MMDTRQEEAREVLRTLIEEQTLFYNDTWSAIVTALTEIRMSTRFIMLEPSVVIPRMWDVLTKTPSGVAMDYVTDLTVMFELCYSQPIGTLVDSVVKSVVNVIDHLDATYASDLSERVIVENNERGLRGALLRNKWFLVIILICVHFNYVIPKVLTRGQK